MGEGKKDALRVNRELSSLVFENNYAKVADLKAGDHGELSFSVPGKIDQETVNSVTYTTTWIGNQIINISPKGKVSPLPF